MARAGRIGALAFVLLLAAGCASKGSDRVAYNAEARADVRRILILESAQPAEVRAGPPGHVFLGAHAVTMLVLLPVSAAINVDNERKSADFGSLVAARGFEPQGALANAIADRLARAGYVVARRKVAQAPTRWPGEMATGACDRVQWTDIDPSWRSEADAVLDVRLLPIGYSRIPLATGRYQAYAGACVRLADARSLAIHYRDSLVFDRGFVFGTGTLLRPEGLRGYTYADYEELVAGADAAIDALLEGLKAMADQVALDLELAPR